MFLQGEETQLRKVSKMKIMELLSLKVYDRFLITWLYGWMICNFTSFSTVFQSYQDDGQIMKGCVQWNPVYVEKILPRAGIKLRTARSVGQRLTH